MAAIDRDLFGPDAWSEELFWTELAGVPATRWYRVATELGPAGAGEGDQAEEVVGYVGLASVPGGPGGPATGDVQTLAVRRDDQGRGLGGVLLDALLAEAEARGCAEVLLEVRADNPGARALYAGRGFAEIAVRPRYYGDGVDAVILRRAR